MLHQPLTSPYHVLHQLAASIIDVLTVPTSEITVPVHCILTLPGPLSFLQCVALRFSLETGQGATPHTRWELELELSSSPRPSLVGRLHTGRQSRFAAGRPKHITLVFMHLQGSDSCERPGLA
jgi:hypothetical protein